MNVEKNISLEDFKNKVNNSLYPLKMGGNINEIAFNELVSIAEQATILLKKDDLVPKKLLSEIHLVAVGIDCENIYYKNDFLSSVSARLMDCFNMILDGESIENEKSDGPRII